MDLQGVLEEVKQLAVEVGTFISKQRETFDLSRVESKHSHDYVSYVDKESEKMIVARLKEILPVAGFITEEKTTEQKDEETELFWVVDPLDGTTNFIHDLIPCFPLSVFYVIISPWRIYLIIQKQKNSPSQPECLQRKGFLPFLIASGGALRGTFVLT